MNTIKSLLLIFIFFALGLLRADPIECIQYRIQLEPELKEGIQHEISEKYAIPGTKGALRTIHSMNFNQSEPDDSTLYEGLVIEYQKQGDKLLLNISCNVFQGFMELAPGKYSPMMTADRRTLELPRDTAEWTQIKLKGYEHPLFIRCALFKSMRHLEPEPSAPEQQQ